MNHNSLNNLIKYKLDEYKQDNLYREINIFEKNRNYLNFCDNDYLGLRNSSKIHNIIKKNLENYPLGSGASHLISGHHNIHSDLECLLSNYLGYEKTLLCSTGYMANLAILTALNKITDKKLFLYHDKLNHASLIDATLLNNIKFTRFRHNDLDHLENLIKKNQEIISKNTLSFIITEGLFSMDGDRPNLERLKYLKEKYKVYIILDNAHDFLVKNSNIEIINNCVDIYMATLGKAAGGFGAFIAGDKNFIESIIQFARSYIYTTAISPLMTYINYELVKEAVNNNSLREKLDHNINYFVAKANENNLNIINKENPSHIQPIIINSNKLTVDIANKLKEKNILLSAIRYPTVPKNLARLRITLSARHEVKDINYLINLLSKFLNN